MRGSDWASTIGAAVFAAVAAFTALALIAPENDAARMAIRVFPLAEPHAEAAERALERKDFTTARMESLAELGVSPIHEDAWLRLARVDLAQHGRLTAEGADALNHAYDAAPYDLNPRSARITFVLDNFAAIPAAVKPSVMDELGAWAASPNLRPALMAAAARAPDPATLDAIRVLPRPQPN